MKKTFAIFIVMAMAITSLFPAAVFAAGLTTTLGNTMEVKMVSSEIEIPFLEAVDEESVIGGITLADNDGVSVPISVKLKNETTALVKYGELDMAKTYTLTLAGTIEAVGGNTLGTNKEITLIPTEREIFAELDLSGEELGAVDYTSLGNFEHQIAGGSFKEFAGVAIATDASVSDDIKNSSFIVKDDGNGKYLELLGSGSNTWLGYVFTDGTNQTPINTNIAFDVRTKSAQYAQDYLIATNNYSYKYSSEAALLSGTDINNWKFANNASGNTTSANRIEIDTYTAPTANGLSPTPSADGFYHVKNVALMQDNGKYIVEQIDMNDRSKKSARITFKNFPRLGSFCFKNYREANSTEGTKNLMVSDAKVYEISSLDILKHGIVGSNYEVVMTDDVAVFGDDPYLNESNYRRSQRKFVIPMSKLTGLVEMSTKGLKSDEYAFGTENISFFASLDLVVSTPEKISVTEYADSLEFTFAADLLEDSLDGKVILEDSEGNPIEIVAQLKEDNPSVVVVNYGDLIFGEEYKLTFKSGIARIDEEYFTTRDRTIILTADKLPYQDYLDSAILVEQDFTENDDLTNSPLYLYGTGTEGDLTSFRIKSVSGVKCVEMVNTRTNADSFLGYKFSANYTGDLIAEMSFKVVGSPSSRSFRLNNTTITSLEGGAPGVKDENGFYHIKYEIERNADGYYVVTCRDMLNSDKVISTTTTTQTYCTRVAFQQYFSPGKDVAGASLDVAYFKLSKKDIPAVDSSTKVETKEQDIIPIKFSVPIDSSTLTDDSIILINVETEEVISTKLDSYDEINFTANLRLNEYLDPGAEYKIVVKNVNSVMGYPCDNAAEFILTVPDASVKATEVTFKNSAGAAIETLGGNVNAKATVSFNSTVVKNAVVFLALCDDKGVVREVKTDNKPLALGTDSVTVELTDNFTPGANWTLKCFAWIDGDSIIMSDPAVLR